MAVNWEQLLNNLGPKPTYESKYQSKLDDLLQQITDRKEFSYDFNADPLYQQYKDNYVKLGAEASQNAMANAAQLSGGYGNSYATTAAAQANQQYLTQLNNVIPELANAALNKYQIETENLYNKYGAVGNAEDRDYGHYRDAVSDYYTERDYLTNGYRDQRDFDYRQYRDSVADSQWQQQFSYQQERDKVSDSQWDKNFAYNMDRDAVSDSQWQQQFDLSKWQAQQSAAHSAASLAWQKEKYAQEQAAKKAEEEAQLYSGAYAANQSDYARYYNFATEHMSQEQAREYLNRLYDDHKISSDQLRKLAQGAGLPVL